MTTLFRALKRHREGKMEERTKRAENDRGRATWPEDLRENESSRSEAGISRLGTSDLRSRKRAHAKKCARTMEGSA